MRKHSLTFLRRTKKNNKAIILDKVQNKNDFDEVKLIYKVIKRNSDTTLLDVNLITGKSHQIRAQLSHIGHPIVGDKKYMDSVLYKENVAKYKYTTQKLTCYKIKFGKFDNEDLKYLSGKIFKIER